MAKIMSPESSNQAARWPSRGRCARLVRGGLLGCLAFVAFTAAAAAQEGPPPKDPYVNCPYCNHTGDKPCKRCSKQKIKTFLESGALYCSEIAECKGCGGAMRVDCEKCVNPAVEARNQKRVRELQDWLAKRREKVDKLIGHPCMHAESRWFQLAFDLKGMMVGKVRYEPYELMHLYLKRFEEHREHYKKVLEVSDADLPDKCEIYMWRDGRDQALAALKFTEMGASGAGVKLMGANSIYTMHFQRRYFADDETLHRNMLHNITHLLVSQMTPAQWLGRLKAGWVDAGLAHYFEFKLDGKCTTYCYQEVAREMDFRSGKWLVPVRRMVAAGRHPTFAEVAEKNTDQLESREHALCFSWVHFLLEGDFEDAVVAKHGSRGKALVAIVAALKAKQEGRQALQAVYGWNPLTFEEKWKEWVLRTYPTN